ncbi:hypothetical protein BEL04_06205 [Mucilaginibacter sp. PPCGB 2223]|uniref:universal stress protein n=1 Tax=Mucilaginibacter sp. PPCGB 2223 TaxID=1886027 RepID=UPI0008243B41|nr:universal stress protein [Mucilaginibacter sp. PPCGB 2223]OCX53875.1 hypothetical protein BEL04_06205 [Mucilaginibacter sp. PPCGB 2223]
MKKILVLTNLSYKAENAALYALKLAEKAGANIILYQSLDVPVYSGVHTDAESNEELEELQKDSLAQLANLAARLGKHQPSGQFKPAIEIFNEFGDLTVNVNHLINERAIDLIVMGAKNNAELSYLVFGETNAVLTGVKCPILFVPYKASYEGLNTVIYSSDLKKAYPKAVAFLTDLAKIDNSDIIVAHIGAAAKFDQNQCIDLFQQIFEYPNVTYKQLPNGSVSEQLERFAIEVEADLTVMIHHEHKLYGMPLPDNSTKMLEKQATPLLVLPD